MGNHNSLSSQTTNASAGASIEHFKPKGDAGIEATGKMIFISWAEHQALQREVELLKSQLADKERIIQLLEKSSK